MLALAVLGAVDVALVAVLVGNLLRRPVSGRAAWSGREADAAPAEAAPGRAFDVEGRTPAGEPVAVGVVGVGHPTLLAFLSSACVTCRDLWEALGRPGAAAALAPGTRVVVVTAGEARERPAAVARLAPASTPVVMSDRAWEQYRVAGAPYFVAVDGPAGVVVGEGPAASWPDVVRLAAAPRGAGPA